MNFYTYYRTKFPYDLLEIRGTGFGHADAYEDGIIDVDFEKISLESRAVQQWNQQERDLFASALFFSVLIDQVCYTYFYSHYKKFQSRTSSPKFVDYFGHYHPKYILRKMGADYTESIRHCNENAGAQLLPEAIDVFRHATDNFLSEHVPEIGRVRFWNKCMKELALVPEKYMGKKSVTTNTEGEHEKYTLLNIKNSEALLEAKRAWDEKVKREEEEGKLIEKFQKELKVALSHSTSELFGGSNTHDNPIGLKEVSFLSGYYGQFLHISPHRHRYRTTQAQEIADTIMEKLFRKKLEIESAYGETLSWSWMDKDGRGGGSAYNGKKSRNRNHKQKICYSIGGGSHVPRQDILNNSRREDNIKRIVDSCVKLEKALLPHLKEIAGNIKEETSSTVDQP